MADKGTTKMTKDNKCPRCGNRHIYYELDGIHAKCNWCGWRGNVKRLIIEEELWKRKNKNRN